MIFELPDIFFGSHKKRKGITTTAGETDGFIKKAEKALPQAAFSKNPVISFSVLRAKSVTVVDTISTTVIFYFPPSEEWFLRKAGLFPNISVHRRDARRDLLRP